MSELQERRRGALLVFGSAAVWSFGGAIARYLSVTDSWTIVFWRSFFAAAFLLGFMLWRQGGRGTCQLFGAMGLAGVPLIAALMAFVLFRERVSAGTWLAIAAVLLGVGIMVSGSIVGQVSPVGDGLALLIAVVFAGATVITRRHADVGMMPAVCLGTVIAACVAAALGTNFRINATDAGLLFLFGALNLGLGMALFVTGVRLLPSALAALIGTAEPVLGPVWVWLVHGEVPGARTLIGGTVVFVALLAHLGWQFHQQKQIQAMPLPD